jgi:hypothetical protein
VLPAVVLDLKVEAEGLAPLYLWDVEPKRQASLDLAFRQGASVSGFVHDSLQEPVGPSCRVRLAAADGTDVFSADGKGGRKPSFAANTNRRGFFQITGVPAGSYLVVAEDSRKGRAEAPATVSRARESRLATPIELLPAGSLTITLDPPLSPAEQPWSVQLLHGRSAAQISRHYPVRAASELGRVRFDHLLAGSYHVLVTGRSTPDTRSPSRWGDFPVELNQDDQETPLSIRSTRLCGSVKLGARALQARLDLDVMTGFSTEVESDDEGSFCILVPRDEAFEGRPPSLIDVRVTSVDPAIHRTIRKWVDLSEPEASIELILGDQTIAGSVVDEQRRPSEATVIASEGESPLATVTTGTDGTFSLMGLPQGDIRVEAMGSRGASEALVVSTRQEGVDPIQLVLRKGVARIGKVSAGLGPVPAALVLLKPLDVLTGPREGFPVNMTDGEGKVSLWVPEAARSFGFVVTAPGHPLRMGRAAMASGPWPAGKSLELPMPAQSGGLAIEDLPALDLWKDPGAPRPYVTHGGFWFLASLLSRVRGAGATSEGSRLFFPSVEPGSYGLCYLTIFEADMLQTASGLSNCTQVEVVPGETAILSARRLGK